MTSKIGTQERYKTASLNLAALLQLPRLPANHTNLTCYAKKFDKITALTNQISRSFEILALTLVTSHMNLIFFFHFIYTTLFYSGIQASSDAIF